MQELEILISIQPNWIEKIAKLIKTIEVRKTCPTLKPPFKCRIYCTKDAKTAFNNHNGNMFLSPKGWQDYSECNGKVVGEFICDKITRYNCDKDYEEYFVAGYVGAYMPLKEMCLTNKDLMEYGKGKPLYGWHISELKIYEKPKELSEFKKSCHGIGLCAKCDKNVYYRGNCDGGAIKRPPQSWCYVKGGRK